MVTPLSTQDRLGQPGHLRWESREPSPRQKLEDALEQWLMSVAHAETLFEKHVYNNEDATQWDFRQHRRCLYALLADGEELAIKFASTKEAAYTPREIESKVSFIDEKLLTLKKTLDAWHGSAEVDPSIPESLKESFKDLENLSLTDLDFNR